MLQIKQLIIGIALSFLGMGTAVAGERVDKQLDASATGVVKVENVRGDIDVRVWDREQVAVKGELDEFAEKFIFEREGNVTRIRVQLPDGRNLRGDDGSKLRITIPEGSLFVFDGVSTDIKADGVAGGVEISSVSGDIWLENIGKKIIAKSVSGDVKFSRLNGPARLSSVSGDVRGDLDGDVLELKSVSGDVRVVAKMLSSLQASSVSGDVHIEAGLKGAADANLSSVSGDAELKLLAPVNARFDLSTGPGGDIKNKLTDDKPTSSIVRDHKLGFSHGSGEASVNMTTVSGTLIIKQK